MFSVSARTQYAIRAMAHLARLEGKSATAADIAGAQGIPLKYLEGILSRLKLSGLVDSERGKNGGYRMQGRAEDLSMLAIVEAMDGSVKPVSCVDSAASCSQGRGCLPRKFWIGLKASIDAYLNEHSLKDIVEGDQV